MSMIKVRESDAAAHAAKALQQMLDKARSRNVLFLVSGGSSLSILNASKKWRLPRKMTVSLVDERLTDDVKKRNWTPFKQTVFYRAARDAKKTFFNPLGRGLKQTDKRFDAFLRGWLAKNENGVVILVLGVGGDGHTGAIFPNKNKARFAKDFRNPSVFAKAHTAPTAPVSKKRLTVTLSFITEHADNIIMFAVGKEKEAIAKRAYTGRVAENALPGMAIARLPQTLLYTSITR